MAEKKTWQIDPENPISFDAPIEDKDITDTIQADIRNAVQQTVLAKLHEHGLLERGESIKFASDVKNRIIKPPTRPSR